MKEQYMPTLSVDLDHQTHLNGKITICAGNPWTGLGWEHVATVEKQSTVWETIKFAERITSCVNGCAGIANPEAVGELLELAGQIVLAAEQGEANIPLDIVEGARAAIAKAKQAN